MIPDYTIVPPPKVESKPVDPQGRIWWAVPDHGPAQGFLTPWEAQMALTGAGFLYTQEGNGPRVKLGRKLASGEWT